MQPKAFCKGLFCKNYTRYKNNAQCVECGVYLCGVCEIESMENHNTFCVNCYLQTFSPDWEKLNIEFEEMLIALGVIEDGKKRGSRDISKWKADSEATTT